MQKIKQGFCLSMNAGLACRPFTNAAAMALVNALSQTLTTVTISGINLVNVTQASLYMGAHWTPNSGLASLQLLSQCRLLKLQELQAHIEP